MKGTTNEDFVRSNFPSEYIVVVSEFAEEAVGLANNTCNVIARDASLLPRDSSTDIFGDRPFVLGNKTMTIEPLSIATRGDDEEFSYVIDMVINALFYGEEQGLSKNMSRCTNSTPLTGNVSDLNFMNAVFCVGNYRDLIPARLLDISAMNQINNGTTGMLYASPFGDLDRKFDLASIPSPDHVHQIKEQGYLNCGVVTPAGYSANNIDKLVGMSADYCRSLAAAIFQGDYEAVTLTSFENDRRSIAALTTSEIDVLSGARVEKRVGVHFSEPFYYGA
jgi:hypothetical protein